MGVYKCKMCGGSVVITDSRAGVGVCDYCGTEQTVSKTREESLHSLFDRANVQRMRSEFDKAERLYEKIIQEDDKDAEAYWGLILCRYGIEYVEDPKTKKRVPTCHRISYESIIADDDYKTVIKLADSNQKAIYEREAREIDRIQKDALVISEKEKPYDVFICYKETDDNGKRTKDSAIANDIYYQLKEEGFKVFYAAVTLEDKLGSAYEPIIFAALNSAKVMLSIGTKPEYFNAVWVKNEWSRFLKMMKKNRSKMLIPCYRDMDAYDLPEEFAHLQAQDMGRIAFIPDLVRNIKKIIHGTAEKQEVKEVVRNVVADTSGVDRLIKNGQTYMKLGNFQEAEEVYKRVTKEYPEDYRGWWGLILCKTNNLKNINMDPELHKQIRIWYGYIKQLASKDDYKKVEQAFVPSLQQYASEHADAEIADVNKKIKNIQLKIDNYECDITRFTKSKNEELKNQEETKQKLTASIEDYNKKIEQKEKSATNYLIAALVSSCILGIGILIGALNNWVIGAPIAAISGLIAFASFTNALDKEQLKFFKAELAKNEEKLRNFKSSNNVLASMERSIMDTKEVIEKAKVDIENCKKYLMFGKEKISQYCLCQICATYSIEKATDKNVEKLRSVVYNIKDV